MSDTGIRAVTDACCVRASTASRPTPRRWSMRWPTPTKPTSAAARGRGARLVCRRRAAPLEVRRPWRTQPAHACAAAAGRCVASPGDATRWPMHTRPGGVGDRAAPRPRGRCGARGGAWIWPRRPRWWMRWRCPSRSSIRAGSRAGRAGAAAPGRPRLARRAGAGRVGARAARLVGAGMPARHRRAGAAHAPRHPQLRGDPAFVLPDWLRHASARHGTLPAGTVVSTGTWAGAPAATPGDAVRLEFPGIGMASTHF